MQKLLGTVALSLLAPAVIGQCINASAGATSFGGGDDIVVNAGAGIDMGFLFPIGAASYQFVHPSSNGFAWLSDGSAAITNSDLTPSELELFTEGPRVAVLWDDMNLIVANGGDLLVDTSVANQCTITWANVVPFGQTVQSNFQCTLYSSGQIDLAYDGPTFQITDSIVGVSPGLSTGVQTTSVDLSAGAATTDDMTFELFPANSLDLAGQIVSLFPTGPGYVAVLANAGCATISTYGVGCVAIANASYEEFPQGTIDVCQTGTAITFLRTGAEYTVLDSIPGTYMAPTAAAVVVTATDDGYGVVTLSAPMPVAGGTTTDLQVCSNGFIALSPTIPTFTGTTYDPTEAKLVEMDVPVIAGPWYDWSPNAGGRVVAEEMGGIAYVTWEAVQPFAQTTTDTFQYQFNIASGDCTIVYDSMSFGGTSTWHEPMFGYTAGNAASVDVIDASAALASVLSLPDVGATPLALDANAPALGANWDITTSNIDAVSPVSITFFGSAQFNIPMTAIGFDAPGCDVNINTILGDITGISASGTSLVSIAIPSTPSLAGAVLTGQSICLTLANNANLLTSNGIEGTIGN